MVYILYVIKYIIYIIHIVPLVIEMKDKKIVTMGIAHQGWISEGNSRCASSKENSYTKEEISDAHSRRGAKGRRKNALSKGEVVLEAQIIQTGLQYQFKCHRCGICCVDCHPIGIDEQDIPRMAEALGIDVPEFKTKYLAIWRKRISSGNEVIESLYSDEHYVLKRDSPCPFFDFETRLCKIYDARPLVCRHYPCINLRKLDIDWKSRTVTFKCDDTCLKDADTLRSFELMIPKYDEAIGHKIPRWTPEEVRQIRSRATNVYLRALEQGRESKVEVIPGLNISPQEEALLMAYSAYLRLRADGWQCKFDYREAEIVLERDMSLSLIGMDLVDLVRIRLDLADRDSCSEEDVISNAI